MKMEYQGIRLDSNLISEIKEIFENEIQKLETEIFRVSGVEFNIASPKQLGEILFDRLTLESNPKKTKTGQYSTSEDTLSKLAKKHEIAKLILEWRSLQKLLTTYVYSLPKQIDPSSNKIHTEFNQTLTTTGRLSSVNPNLQNIPIRTERGKLIRKSFIPSGKDYTLLCADYSQIELRIIAFLSGDSNMKNAFINNEDIHTSTAARVFNIDINQVNEEQRRNAKIVNFGIIYGVSAFGLSNQTNLTRGESKEIIDNYFKSYPKLKEYMSNQISFAREKGYVETILKRKRYLPEINSRNAMIRSSAERNAINTPVQGSAADKIDSELEKKSLKSKLLLQVHDELVFDVHLAELDIVKEIVSSNMENSIEIDIPLKVDIGHGDNWLVAH
jgi:DNA polymerase-1